MNNKTSFYFVYQTEEDRKKEIESLINEIREINATEFVFNNEVLYKTERHGHDFLRGFYQEYITKSGIRAVKYFYCNWIIDDRQYMYENGDFIELKPKLNSNLSNEINDSNLSIPLVKNVTSKILSEDLISVTPKNKSL